MFMGEVSLKKTLVALFAAMAMVVPTLVLAAGVEASGSESGQFPTRTITVSKGGLIKADKSTFTADILPPGSCYWWVRLTSLGGSAVKVAVFDQTGTAISSSKLTSVGEESEHTPLKGGDAYQMVLTYVGKRGSAVLNEQTDSGIVAEAGPIQYVPVPIPDMITLDGSASYPLCDIVSYVWTWVGGVDNTPKMVTGMNPSVPWQWFYYIENYTVTLTITDAEGNTATDTTNVYIAFRLNREDNAFGAQQWYANSDGYLKVMIDNHRMNWVNWTVMDCTTSPHIVYESTMYFSGDGVYVSEPFWMSAGQHVQVDYELDGGPPGAYMFVYGFFVPIP